MRRLKSFPRPNVVVFVFTAVVVTGAAVGGTVALSGASPAAPRPVGPVSPSALITVTSQQCATGWASRPAGHTVFGIDDRSGLGGTIYLFNPFTGVTVAQARLHPRAEVKVAVRLSPATYQWNCALAGRPVRSSTEQQVRQTPSYGPAGAMVQVPVEPQQMVGPIASYRAYVTTQLTLESSEVKALEAAIASGDTTAARSAWLTAHLTWHRIGGAYDAFGNLGLSIDGTAARLPDGVASPQFTGFHKVEMDLWQTDDLSTARTDVAVLQQDLNQLATLFPGESIPATELPLRTHEILEDALRDELSGDDDYGSGTDMASVAADVDGTRELLSLLTPLLDSRAPHLVATVDSQLVTLDAALSATQANGHWVAVTLVPLSQREQIDGAIGNATT
jgi:high-affinity iron transporter